MARDAGLWQRGHYQPKSRDDRARMRKYASLKKH
jgi:hypothetical protein